MRVETDILLTDSRHTSNADIRLTIRNLYHLEDGLIQPSSVQVEITRESAKTLIAHLQQILMMSSETDYLIHGHGANRIDGVDYDSIEDYLNGMPAED